MARVLPIAVLDDDLSDSVQDQEIDETFRQLGLGSVGPTGYHYLSNWGPEPRVAIFDVVRTSSSTPRRA